MCEQIFTNLRYLFDEQNPNPFQQCTLPPVQSLFWALGALYIYCNSYEQQVLDVDTTAPAVASLKGAQALNENNLRSLQTFAPNL